MPLRCVLLPAIAIATLLTASETEAQFYRRGRGGVFVRAPFVRVNVTPGGVRVRAPGVNVNTPRNRYVPGVPVYRSGGVIVQEPTLVGSPAPVIVARPVSPRLSEAELAALGLIDLVAELANRSNELNAELGGLGGGQAWQKYLALPGGLAGGEADPLLLGQLLARFDSVARDQQFLVITGLSGFEPVRTALRVTVDRLNTAPATPPVAPAVPSPTPATGEALPTPASDGETGGYPVF